MPNRINHQLSAEQLEQIQWAQAHDPRAEVVRRATAIYLLHQGHSAEAVGAMLAASRASVNNWHQRWRAGGLEALANQPISGRPPKAGVAYRAVLEATFTTDPHTLGYAFSVWTLDRLVAHLARETGIRLSEGRLREWMTRWGYVYRQPKTDLSQRQDMTAREQVQQWLDTLKKVPNGGLAAFSLWTKPP